MNSWPFQLAYDLGRGARYLTHSFSAMGVRLGFRGPERSTKAGANGQGAERAGKRRVRWRMRRRNTVRSFGAEPDVVDQLADSTELLLRRRGPGGALNVAPQLNLAWEDIEEIADVSGLTDALGDMAAIARRHEHSPVLAKLVQSLESLDDSARDELGRRFFERIEREPVFRRFAQAGGYAPALVSQLEMEQMARVVSVSGWQVLRDLELSAVEIMELGGVLQDVSQPLVDLSELYLAPKTLKDRFRRYWRIQRVGFKALKIMSRSAYYGPTRPVSDRPRTSVVPASRRTVTVEGTSVELLETASRTKH